ncbi:MAG TPA: hypothetical protein VJZ32_10185 [Candidatus Bathyarchaeia archaeon]|nr:hypothetical protein [Candidatus Bathyarchaeia archaeon]
MLFENEFSNARVIFNKYAQGGSILTSGEVNLLVGSPAIPLSPFIEFATETFDQTKIDRSLTALVKTYDGQSVAREICDVQPFVQEQYADLKFVQIPIRTLVSKSWFIDPTIIGQDHIFAGFGSAIAEGELRYVLHQIQENAERRKLSLTYEEIEHEIIGFRSREGNPSAILLPLDLYMTAHSWLTKDGVPVISYANGRTKITIDLPSGGFKISAYFCREETGISGMVIYDRGHGEIVYKKPRPTEFMDAQLFPSVEHSTKLELLAKVILSYRVKNRDLALLLTY